MTVDFESILRLIKLIFKAYKYSSDATLASKKHKRSRVLVFLLLPALVFMWLVGWCICTLENPLDTSRRKAKPKKVQAEDNGVTFVVTAFEEEQIEIRD